MDFNLSFHLYEQDEPVNSEPEGVDEPQVELYLRDHDDDDILNNLNFVDLNEESSKNVFENDVEEVIVLANYEEVEAEKDSESFFNMLPDEIIATILSYLTLKELCRLVAPVCKQWFMHARNPVLWQRLPYEAICNVDPDNVIRLVQSNCPLLKELSLKCQCELTLYECQVIAQACPMLKILSLAFCTQVNKLIIKVFVRYCPKLQELNIEGCDVNDDALFLLEDIPLKKLNVSHCTHLSDNGLIFVAKKCPHLQDINFDGVQWISDGAVATLVDNCCDQLCNIWLDGANLSDSSIRLLARCKNLRTLSLSFCDLLSDNALKWIHTMKHLKKLRLKKGTEFSANALKELFYELHHLRMNNGTGLLHLDLPECSEVDDVVLTTVAESSPNLVAIDLSWCWEITDVGLEQLVTQCRKLETACLIGLYKLFGEPLKQAPRQLPKLKTLDARQCNRISDDLLAELASQMRKTTITNYYGEEVKPARSLLSVGVGSKSCW